MTAMPDNYDFIAGCDCPGCRQYASERRIDRDVEEEVTPLVRTYCESCEKRRKLRFFDKLTEKVLCRECGRKQAPTSVEVLPELVAV